MLNRGRSVAVGAGLVVSAAVLGCGSEEREAAGSGLASVDRSLAPTFDTVYTVGAVDGEPWETFGSVSQVAFDAAGKLYIFDQQNGRIVVVGPDGSFVREVGKKGGGPGEFQSPFRMAVANDGSIAVADFGVGGFTLFDTNGEFTRTMRIESERGLPTSDMTMHPSQRSIVTQDASLMRRMGSRIAAGSPMPDPPPTIPVRKISLDTGDEVVLHEAWRPPRPEAGADDEITGRNSSGGRMMIRMAPQVAFQPRLHVAVLPDGRYLVVDSTTYTIDVLAADGTVEKTLERPIPPTPVTDQIREKEKAIRLAALEDGGAPRLMVAGSGGAISSELSDQMSEMFRRQIESLLFADVVPVIARLGVEWNGRIWVERTSGEPGEPGPIDVVDAEGAYHGTIPSDGPRMPAAFGPDGLVAYIEKDELDVPMVRTMRLKLIESP